MSQLTQVLERAKLGENAGSKSSLARAPGDHGFDQQLLPLRVSVRADEPCEPAGVVRPHHS